MIYLSYVNYENKMKYDYKNRAGYKKDHIHEISGLPISICLRKINVITGFEKY